MKHNGILLLAMTVLVGCGAEKHAAVEPRLAVVFFGVERSTGNSMETWEVALDDLQPGTSAISGVYIPPVSLAQRLRWPSNLEFRSPSISYAVLLGEKGRLHASVCFDRWVPTPDGTDGIGVSEWEARKEFRPEAGESAVFVLPSKSDPKYLVCVVVTEESFSSPTGCNIKEP